MHRTHRALPALRTREEFRSVTTALALYVNCLRRWALHFFPWQHGEDHLFSAAAARNR